MLPQNKFLKLINDVVTSRYFSLVLSLIGLSVGTGLLINKTIGLIAFILIAGFSLIFLLLLFIVTKRTSTGYKIINAEHVWRMNDPNGMAGKGRKKFTILLTRPLKSVREIILSSETLSAYSGDNLLSVNMERDGDQKIAIINFDAQYPRRSELKFEFSVDRQIGTNNGNGKYIEIPVRNETKKTEANIFIPKNNQDGSEIIHPSLYQRKNGATQKLAINQKDIVGNISHLLTTNDEYDLLKVQWKTADLDVETDYIIRWRWTSERD